MSALLAASAGTLFDDEEMVNVELVLYVHITYVYVYVCVCV